MKTIRFATGLIVVVLVGLSVGCASPQYQANQNMANQAAFGAALGALAGAVIGNNSHGAFGNGEGAVAGAGLGALIGGAMGHQKDQTQAQIGAVNEMASTVVINVRNSNGSYTPVTLRKVGNQYMGPRGEYYQTLPGEAQLKAPYGF